MRQGEAFDKLVAIGERYPELADDVLGLLGYLTGLMVAAEAATRALDKYAGMFQHQNRMIRREADAAMEHLANLGAPSSSRSD